LTPVNPAYSFSGVDAITLLDGSDFFRSISAVSKKAVAAICIPKVMRRRETLFMEGEKGHSMYLLAQGTVQLFKTSLDGKEVVIKLVKPGEIFGEVVLFESDRYPVSACSLTASEVFLLPRRQFHCLLLEEGFRNDFIAMLLGKQRYLADQIFRLSALDVEQRFFHFLRDHYGEKELYLVDITKRDVAAAIDALPETLSRLLLKLREEGEVQWDGERLTLRKGFWEGRE
jgi:CRP-like cAMP-binding protein